MYCFCNLSVSLKLHQSTQGKKCKALRYYFNLIAHLSYLGQGFCFILASLKQQAYVSGLQFKVCTRKKVKNVSLHTKQYFVQQQELEIPINIVTTKLIRIMRNQDKCIKILASQF